MGMRAITWHYGLETAVTQAINAGIDILLFGNNIGHYDPYIARKVSQLIKKQVIKGQITEQRIDIAYQRIQQFKNRITKHMP